MQLRILCSIWLVFLVACANAPTPTLPIITPFSPSATAMPPALPSVTPASAPQIQNATPLPTVAPRALTVYQQFSLRDLPGTGRNPIAVTIIGDKVYAINSTTRNIGVLQNNRVARFIPLNAQPNAVATDPAQSRLFIASDDKTLRVLVNEQVTQTQALNESINAILFFENRLFVGSGARGEILVLDPGSLAIQTRITIPNAFSITNLAGDTIHHRLYANSFDKTSVIDSTNLRVVSTLETKASYFTLLAYPAGDLVLASLYDSSTQTSFLHAFNPQTGKSVARVQIGSDPHQAVMNRDGSRAYVANSYTNDVSVIELRTMTLVATIPVGTQPWSLALDDNAHRLYVGNYGSDSVSVINTDNHQLVATVPLAMIPTAIASNENLGRVYLANASTDSLFVIEGSRVVREINVGRRPVSLAHDAASNRLLIANANDRTLSVLDETTFAVRATQPITKYVTDVTLDATSKRVFVNDMILDYTTLAPIGTLTMRGLTINSTMTPNWIRLNTSAGRIYAIGSNGVPGSNGRMSTYSVDATTLAQRGILYYSGNTSTLELDPQTNRVFLAGTHPMAGTHELGVYDLNDTRLITMPLPARTTGMLFNPQTQHLFLAHADSTRFGNPQFVPADNTLQIFDTNSFGEVARIALDAPGKMARLGNTIYVATNQGTIALIQDASAPVPPSPTPIFTATPYPTLTPSPRTPTTVRASTVTSACTIALGNTASSKWNAQIAARLGCPTETERNTNFAAQNFERGSMLWREDERRIYVLLSDKTWKSFDDSWIAGMPEDSCPGITAPNKPKRGFGKVWCEQADVRTNIGSVIGVEVGYATPTQRFERGTIFAGNQPGRVFILFATGTWE